MNAVVTGRRANVALRSRVFFRIAEDNEDLGLRCRQPARDRLADAVGSALLQRSEKLIRQAISSSKQPSTEMYFVLGDTLVDRESYEEAATILHRALDLNKTSRDTQLQASILRDLIMLDDQLKHLSDVDRWFEALVQTGIATGWDWQNQAARLDARRRYADAGVNWQQAATLISSMWSWWCEAAGSYELAVGKEDSALYAGRTCISAGSGKSKSEARLADAHRAIASVLNDRGVYEEALGHATEATALAPENASAYDAKAVALLGLRRNQEAINAAKQAIRLSDGKYGLMHFHLGNAYFETENWQFAKQSFEKAAELMPSEDASAYNTALCLQRLGLFLDAARWYEEVLRRYPKRTDRPELLDRIAALRR